VEQFLHIALAQDPTRQTFWRVVRVFGAIFCVWIGVIGIYRLLFTWNAVVPIERSTHIRIIKTEKNIANSRIVTRGLEVIPGIPTSITDFLNQSSRVLNISVAHDGTVTVILDRKISEAESAAFVGFGASVSTRNNETILTNASTIPEIRHSFFSGLVSTLFLNDDGIITTTEGSSNISVDTNTITIDHLVALTPPEIDTVITADTLLFASFSPKDIEGLTSKVFTQNTPGLLSLFTAATHNGLSAILRGTTDSLRYTFAFPITENSREYVSEMSLRAAAKELVEIPSINGIVDYLSDGSRTIALRSREEATLVFRDESPYRFLTATSLNNSVTMTETPAFLTISNDASATNLATQPQCLSNAVAFVTPKALQTLYPEQILFTPQTFFKLFSRASAIASSTSMTRMCL
jgi:hypothetical protein